MATGSVANKVRVAFIGAGAVTAYHHLPGLRLDPRAELVAICDTSSELLNKRQEEWNVADATTDPEALCKSENVDAVVIATPNDTHRGRGRAGRQACDVREAPRLIRE
jgi:predicted dehydrogenase